MGHAGCQNAAHKEGGVFIFLLDVSRTRSCAELSPHWLLRRPLPFFVRRLRQDCAVWWRLLFLVSTASLDCGCGVGGFAVNIVYYMEVLLPTSGSVGRLLRLLTGFSTAQRFGSQAPSKEGGVNLYGHFRRPRPRGRRLSTCVGLPQPEFHVSRTVAGPDGDVLWGMLAAETQLTRRVVSSFFYCKTLTLYESKGLRHPE